MDILPESQETFNNLRAIKCYLKFHHAAQSAVAAKQSKNQGCPSRNKGGGATDNQETESRVICKNVSWLTMIKSLLITILTSKFTDITLDKHL